MLSIHSQKTFTELMTEFQGRLYGYIFKLVGNSNNAHDILQETNLVLWKKSSEYEIGTNFKAWSFSIANFQIMSFKQKKSRDRHIFSSDFLKDFPKEELDNDQLQHARLNLLDSSMGNLSQVERTILDMRYTQKKKVQDIAEALNLKANSLSQTLLRLRKKIMHNIKQESA